jgi:hypothetical protein
VPRPPLRAGIDFLRAPGREDPVAAAPAPAPLEAAPLSEPLSEPLPDPLPELPEPLPLPEPPPGSSWEAYDEV